MELLKRCPRICITFVAQDDPNFEAPNNYTTYFQSAIVTGTVVLVEDNQEKVDGLRALCQKLTPQYMTEGLFNAAIQHSLSVTSVWRVDMDDLSERPRRKDDPPFPFPIPQRERYDVRYSNSALLLGSALFFHSYLLPIFHPKAVAVLTGGP